MLSSVKFSIITCTYNRVDCLLENIDSVKDQSYSNYEHIFVDGFSNDGTWEVILAYQKKHPDKVKCFQFPARGIANAMNEGTKKSNGDYIIHLHSDDSFYQKDVLKQVNFFLQSHLTEDYDWIYGKVNVTGSNKKEVCQVPRQKLFQRDYRDWFSKYLERFRNFIPHQAVFIKPAVFRDFSYFDESLRCSMDWDLWLKIVAKTKWTFFDLVISNYSVKENTQTNNPKNKESNNLESKSIIKKHLSFTERILAVIFNTLLNLFHLIYLQIKKVIIIKKPIT